MSKNVNDDINKFSILIVDDVQDMHLILSTLLRHWGYKVVVTSNGKEAWDVLQEQDIHVVISDWSMPVMTGVELCRNVRAAQFDRYVYFILLTANNQKSNLIEGMEAGADDFLAKPLDRDELRVCLRAAERIVNLEQNLRRNHKQLQETNAALIQAEKLSTLGSIAGSVAHELNSPLGAILNAAERVREIVLEERQTATNTAYIQEDLELLINATLHCRAVIADLLASARTAGDHETCRLADVLEAWLRLYRKELEMYGIELSVEQADERELSISRSALSQVLTNVLMNARDALLEQPDDERRISISTEALPTQCRITVRDSGQGIPPHVLGSLFEAFVTTKEVGKGTGLGLWVTKSILENIGGSIHLENLTGSGVQATMCIPAVIQ